MKGSKKCSEKNRFSVALFTLNPPHRVVTTSCPIHGMADIRLVITVANRSQLCIVHYC